MTNKEQEQKIADDLRNITVEQVHKRRNGETVLVILQENDKLHVRIAELEAELKQKTERQFGTIKTGLFLHEFVGDGETDDGKKFELCLINCHVPGVYYNSKMFLLFWDDIVNLAELAGLFDEVTE